MTTRQQRWVYTLMAVNAAIFLLLYLTIGAHYRLAADDFHYLQTTKDLGIWDAMIHYYHHWNARWSATLVTNSALLITERSGSALPFFLLTVVLGLFAIRTLISELAVRLRLPIRTSHVWMLSGYLLAIVFYASFSKDDIWFWITVMPMYLWGSFAALLGGGLLLSRKSGAGTKLLLLLSFLYVGGASETVALTTLLLLFYFGITRHRSKSKMDLDGTKLHLATLACLVGFGLDMMSSGVHVRMEHLPHLPLADRLMIGLWNYLKMILFHIPVRLLWIIPLVAPIGFLGRKHLRFQHTSLTETFHSNKRLWLLADLFVLLLAMAMAISMCEMGPTRAWLPATFIALAVAITLSYQLGTWAYILSKGKLWHIVLGAQLVMLGYQGFEAYRQIPQAVRYATAVDARMDSLEEHHRNNTCSGAVEPLPTSGWLFSGEITSDTTDFRNKHLDLYLGTSCRHRLKDRP